MFITLQMQSLTSHFSIRFYWNHCLSILLPWNSLLALCASFFSLSPVPLTALSAISFLILQIFLFFRQYHFQNSLCPWFLCLFFISCCLCLAMNSQNWPFNLLWNLQISICGGTSLSFYSQEVIRGPWGSLGVPDYRGSEEQRCPSSLSAALAPCTAE